MATIELILCFISLAFLFHFVFINRNSVAINWPVAGMLPQLLWHKSRFHDKASKVLRQSAGTFVFKGPWFTGDFIVTSDPANVHHMLSKSFSNYPNGEEFKAIFEPLFGDGIIAADSGSWRFQRKMLHSYLGDAKFRVFLERNVEEKVANCLFPVLDHFCTNEMEVHLNDVLLRLSFDIMCLLFLGRDPKCLSVGFPEVPYDKAFDDIERAIMYRVFVPEKYWKLLRWLQIGQEKKMSNGLKIIDDFIYDSISSKRDETMKKKHIDPGVNFLTAYLIQEKEIVSAVKSGNKFLRDVAVNLLVAGRDTSSAALSWFFFLLSKNPEAEIRILEEIREIVPEKTGVPGSNEVNKLVYLHAALCETLRLYPTVPVNPRCAVRQDTLPSGHWVKEGAKVFIYFYAMGRMGEIWGEDCDEFKPERWISSDGEIVHVPSNKFTAFGAGPRSCLGKDMSFVQMKMIAAAMVLRYRIEVVRDRPVVPSNSLVLHIKHGLKVRVTKRSAS